MLHFVCPACALGEFFPWGTPEPGTRRERFLIRFLGLPSMCPGAQGRRAGTMETSGKDLRPENHLKLTDAAIREATLPSGKSQHYLHDTEQLGLAIRMRATGGRTWVYMFTKPGMKGTQRKTLGASPKFNQNAPPQPPTPT